jgi:hypothetical protein
MARSGIAPLYPTFADRRSLVDQFGFDEQISEKEQEEFFFLLLSHLRSFSPPMEGPSALAAEVDLQAPKRESIASALSTGEVSRHFSYYWSSLTERFEIERAKETKIKQRPETPSAFAAGLNSIPEGALIFSDSEGSESTSFPQAILNAGSRLFRYFRGFPAFLENNKDDREPGPWRSSGDGISPHQPFVVFLKAGGVSPSGRNAKRQFDLSPVAQRKILDDFMPLPFERQMDLFESRFLDTYDSESPGFASFVREFIFSNLNEVFDISEEASPVFHMIRILYEKRPVYDRFASYALRFSGTRIGGEWFLSLAASYDFERRVFSKLMNSSIPRADMPSRLGAMKGQIGATEPGLGRLRSELYEGMSRAGVTGEQVESAYIRQQLLIYSHLAQSGGDSRSRSLYAWGRMLWEKGETGAAIMKWKETDPAYSFYGRSYGHMRQWIDLYERTKNPSYLCYIDDLLAQESASDRQALLERRRTLGLKPASRINSTPAGGAPSR